MSLHASEGAGSADWNRCPVPESVAVYTNFCLSNDADERDGLCALGRGVWKRDAGSEILRLAKNCEQRSRDAFHCRVAD